MQQIIQPISKPISKQTIHLTIHPTSKLPSINHPKTSYTPGVFPRPMIEDLFGSFVQFGLLGLFFIFFIDSLIFPTVPELFAVYYFLQCHTNEPPLNDPVLWSILLLLTMIIAEIAVIMIYYALAKRAYKDGVPKGKVTTWLITTMQKYTNLLFVHDERTILLNCVAPVLPFEGAFIVVNNWSLRLGIIYKVIGGTTKYALLFLMAHITQEIFVADLALANRVTMAMAILVVVVSVLLSMLIKKKNKKLVARKKSRSRGKRAPKGKVESKAERVMDDEEVNFGKEEGELEDDAEVQPKPTEEV